MNTAGGGESVSERTIEDLRQEKLWLVWNYMPGKNGKMTKVPFSAYGGATGTDEKHKDTLAIYDEAYAAMQNSAPPVWDLRFRKICTFWISTTEKCQTRYYRNF